LALAETDWSAVDFYVKMQFQTFNSPGISIAIQKNGKVVFAKGYGQADIEHDVPAKPTSVFRIGSVTKQFTATMIMQLVKEAWDKVTVRHLLTHTSGIKSYTSIPGLWQTGMLKPAKPADIIKTVADEPLQFEPGTRFEYNNTGYVLLGMIIEKLDGRSYANSLQVRILGPLAMKQTYLVSDSKLVPQRARGYTSVKGGYINAQYLNMDWPFSAGGMESTTLDLLKWDAALYGERLLPKAMLQQMWQPTKLSDGSVSNYGFGWSIGKIGGIDVIEHGGGIHGFGSSIVRVPSKQLAVVVLMNSDSANPTELAHSILGLADPSLNVAPKKDVTDRDLSATKSAREFLDAMLADKVDRSLMTAELVASINPDREKQTREKLLALGAVKSFAFLTESRVRKGLLRQYRITFAKGALTMSVVTDPEKKVAGVGFSL
jgi:CubicO group peptidase (beta-lactamase class C family)